MDTITGLGGLLGMTDNLNPLLMAILQAQGGAGQADTEFEQLQQRNLSARNGANFNREQAGQAYQQAAAAPKGLGDSMQSMFANIGAGIAKNPAIAENAQQSQAMERQQRLQSLRDEYLEKAEIARQLGQADEALKNEVAANKVAAAHQQLAALRLKAIEQGGRMAELAQTLKGNKELEKLRGENDLRVESLRGSNTLRAVQARGQASDTLRKARTTAGLNPDSGFYTVVGQNTAIQKLIAALDKGESSKNAVRSAIIPVVAARMDNDVSMQSHIMRLARAEDPYTNQKSNRRVYLLTGKPVSTNNPKKDDENLAEAYNRAQELVVNMGQWAPTPTTME